GGDPGRLRIVRASNDVVHRGRETGGGNGDEVAALAGDGSRHIGDVPELHRGLGELPNDLAADGFLLVGTATAEGAVVADQGARHGDVAVNAGTLRGPVCASRTIPSGLGVGVFIIVFLVIRGGHEGQEVV